MFYQESRTAKASAIGTIMPWGGGQTTIPVGWIVCDGQSVNAKDFPLLTQAIGDTYNTLPTGNLTGDFPAYSGTIKIPNLNDRTLMDLEQEYFVDPGDVASGAPTGRAADADVDALTLIQNSIGEHESQSVTTIFTDVGIDLIFTLPQSDYDDPYTGRLRGNTLIPGEDFKTLYVAPRKLGRKHIKRHNHSGTIETLAGLNSQKPGRGVIPYHDVHYTLRFQVVDNDAGGGDGDTYYFGWSDDNQSWSGDDDPRASMMTHPGIVAGTGWAGAQAQQGLYAVYWPPSGSSSTEAPSGFAQGQQGKVMAKVASEAPPVNLIPRFVMWTPITHNFRTTPEYNNGHLIDSNQPIKFGYGSQSFNVPGGLTNYYETSDTEGEVRDTLMSHAALNFTANSDTDFIEAHDHDEFDVEFDSTRLRPKSNINVDVRLNTQTDLIQNDANRNALQIDFNVQQPSLSCLYIIRAY